MTKHRELHGKGLGIATAQSFEDEPSSMVHEQLARLKFAQLHISMKGMRVLDFGCGTGYNGFYISEQCAPEQVVGLDILQECISYCKANYATERTEYHVQDALVHNPAFGLFDVALSCEVVEHVNDQQRFLEVLARYLKEDGIAFISTPNKALFSLSKDKSFLNQTHITELFYHELEELLGSVFSEFKVYSQVHKPGWHGAYVDYLCLTNLVHVVRYECFGNNLLGKIASKIAHTMYLPIVRMKDKGYPDVRDRRYTDFEFVEGYDNCAVWFVATCSR